MYLAKVSRYGVSTCGFKLTSISCGAQVLKMNPVGDAQAITCRYKQYVYKPLIISCDIYFITKLVYCRVIRSQAYIELKSESLPAVGLHTARNTITPHPPAQQAPYHQPGYPPFSSPYYHETAISNHPPPPACSTTISSNVSVALALGSPCTLYGRARHGYLTKIECHQCRESCVMRA
jgi:hypothetical protein